jgi:arylsulfatase A-like enzyme
VFGRAFVVQLAVVSVATASGVLCEALLCGVRLFSVAPLDAVLCVGLWLPAAALLSVGLAACLAAACDEESCAAVLARAWREHRQASAAVLLASSVFAALVFALARAVLRFHNTELAAALVTGVVLLLGALSCLLGSVLARSKASWLPGLGVGISVAVLGGIAFAARSGLAQLDPRLAAPPLTFLIAFALADRASSVRVHARCTSRALAGGGLALWALFLAISGPPTPGRLASSGAWTPLWIALAQRTTDFDADGYSSLLGAGDCAPFDAAVHPGALELVGDGIDNNCIGGDSGKAAEPRRPSWGAAAHGAITNLNVVVITIETLRHDHASFIRAEHDTTPELKQLAAESLVFEHMYSAAPHTRLALASLWSSQAPSEIEWLPQAAEKRMRRIGQKTPWLPELLAARGYDTIAVLTDFAAFTEQESANFQRGFRRYDVSTPLQYRGGTMWGFPAAEQTDKAIAYVREARRPFLLWLHLFEPHYTYEQPPDAPRFGTDERARYDAEIWHVDHQIGRLVAALKEQGAWDKTVLLVTGDHGEAFGEHDDRWHGTNLHDPQLRPAALLRVPGLTGKRVRDAVTFTDLAPTITRLLGDRQSFDKLYGRSLTPLLHRAQLPPDAGSIVAESFSVDDGHAYQAALIALPLKLIYVEAGRRFNLYDLQADPGERRPLDPASDPRGRALQQELVGYLERARPSQLRK